MRISNIFLALMVGVFVFGLIPPREYISISAIILFLWLVICYGKICVSTVFIIGVAGLLLAALPSEMIFEVMFLLEFIIVLWISNLIRIKA